MKHPEQYFGSQRDRNLSMLIGKDGQPTIIIDMEDEHTLVQYGKLESSSEDHMLLLGTLGDPHGTRIYNIPSHDVVIAGRDEVNTYTQALLTQAEKADELHYGILAATIMSRFAIDSEKDSVNRLCVELAQTIINSPIVDTMDAVRILDAPNALKETVIDEVRRRLKDRKTLHDVQNDKLIMAFAAHIAASEQITEFEALQHIVMNKL